MNIFKKYILKRQLNQILKKYNISSSTLYLHTLRIMVTHPLDDITPEVVQMITPGLSEKESKVVLEYLLYKFFKE